MGASIERGMTYADKPSRRAKSCCSRRRAGAGRGGGASREGRTQSCVSGQGGRRGRSGPEPTRYGDWEKKGDVRFYADLVPSHRRAQRPTFRRRRSSVGAARRVFRRAPRRLVPVKLACRLDLAGDDHRRADADAAVQIGDVLVVHPDAAVGDEAADRARIVGAVDGVFAARQASAPRRPSDCSASRRE